MAVFRQRGFQELMKEGARSQTGVDDVVLRNIEACKKMANITRTSLGPNGKNKMVINRLEKLFVTNDAATIIRELEVEHPAAKLLVMAARMQEMECGDATNFVLVFGGELLAQAESLIRLGLHPSKVIEGYRKACELAVSFLDGLSCKTAKDIHDEAEITTYMKTVIASKQYGYEDLLAPLVAKACIEIVPSNPAHFNVDRVRVLKVLGSSVLQSTMLKGFAVARPVDSTVLRVQGAKVAVYVTGIDVGSPETKGTVLIKTAEQLESYSSSEEAALEKIMQEIAATGVNVLVSGAKVGEMAMHFVEKYNMLLVKVMSKFQLRRLCNATGATPMVRLGPPTPEEIGHCDDVRQEEVGSTKVTIFEQHDDDSRLSTLILRGATTNTVDDVERAVDDAVNAYKSLTKDPRLVPGAGATEIELAKLLHTEGESCPGLDQYAIKKFAEALEVIPRTLAENAGVDATSFIATLYAAHQEGQSDAGINVDTGDVLRAAEAGVLDSLRSKMWAIKLATDAAVSVLSVDQLIMARPAGGPKPPKMGPMDADNSML